MVQHADERLIIVRLARQGFLIGPAGLTESIVRAVLEESSQKPGVKQQSLWRQASLRFCV
jgi:hypothetical protein